MKHTTEQLLSLLDELKSRIQSGDSFEGTLTYTCIDEHLQSGEWEVSGSYRVGNQDGQGGMRVLHRFGGTDSLLLRYQSTRQAMLNALGHDSVLDKEDRQRAMRHHLDTLDLIAARFPHADHLHSTAEWYLAQASAQKGET